MDDTLPHFPRLILCQACAWAMRLTLLHRVRVSAQTDRSCSQTTLFATSDPTRKRPATPVTCPGICSDRPQLLTDHFIRD